jgi:hypothetical protein
VELRRLRSALRHIELAAGGERSGRDLLLSAMRRPRVRPHRHARGTARAVLARTLAVLGDELGRGATCHELLWTAWTAADWNDVVRTRSAVTDRSPIRRNRDLDAVVALFQAAKRFVERSLDADPRVFVRSILDSDGGRRPPRRAIRGESVRILTPAGALGTEFDTVVIAGVQDGVWPNTRLRGSLLDTWRLADAATRVDSGAASTLDRRRAAMHDELRLLARAPVASDRRVLVTAVDDDDTGPSVFFEFLPDPERYTVDHPLSLRGLVAQHRRALTEPTTRARAERSAQQLAVLADAGVAGAAPREWFGVALPTSSGPLRDLAVEDVRVSPSRLHTLEECELNWVIGDLGGDPGGATAGLGTDHPRRAGALEGSDEASLWAEVESRWGELTFEAEWRDRAELARARDLVQAPSPVPAAVRSRRRNADRRRTPFRGRDPARGRGGVRSRCDPLRLHRPGRADPRGHRRDRGPEDGQARAADRREGIRQPAAGRIPARVRVGSDPCLQAGLPAGRREAARAASDSDALGLRDPLAATVRRRAARPVPRANPLRRGCHAGHVVHGARTRITAETSTRTGSAASTRSAR